MDKLMELSKQLIATVISQHRIDISGEVSYHGIVKTYRKFKIRIDLYKTFLLVTLYVDSSLALAVNNPDLMFEYEFPLDISGSPYPVYVSENAGASKIDDNVRGFLDDVLRFLKSIELSEVESAFFYNNGMRFILSPSRDIKSILDILIDLISKHSLIFNKKSRQLISKNNIPNNLIALFPFLRKYAIADDSERSQLIKALGTKKRRHLIDVVSPLFKEIDSFLNSFEDRPLNDEAILIGNLAELSKELILIEKERFQNNR